jgi:hypothetical protein
MARRRCSAVQLKRGVDPGLGADMSADVTNDAVRLVARDAVTSVSPGELALFESTARRYFQDAQSVLVPGRSREEELGFGAEAVVFLVGPFALELAKRVLTRLVERTGDAAADGLANRVLGWLGGSPDRTPVKSQSLDPGELALVRQTARAEAERLDIPATEAGRLADAIVASLATRI